MVSTHSGIHNDTKRKVIRMKTKTGSVYGIGKILNNFNSYIRTFNPLAAGSIPARPTRKQKGFRHLDGNLFYCPGQSRSTKVYVLGAVAVAAALIFPAGSAQAQVKGWDFYFFGVNAKTFKEADYKMVALGAATSAVVHVGGHYAYAGLHKMSVRQDGFIEVISFNEHSPQQIREFMMAGFVLQHAVGFALTTIPATRQTDFTRGYVVHAWAQTVGYPIFLHKEGDLHWSNHFGGNSDLEYAVYLAAATHNVLRVNWSKE